MTHLPYNACNLIIVGNKQR